MARKVHNRDLDNRTSRGRLPAKGKPYYQRLDEGLHLGYRRLSGGSGTWVMRRYVSAGSYVVERLATADDRSDANDVDVLSFDQAQRLARKLRDERVRAAAGKHGPLTVADAVETYLRHLEESRGRKVDERYRAEALIVPKLGNENVESLTRERLQKWLTDVAKAPALLRTRPGKKQNHRKPADDSEAVRRRRSSANRTWTIFRGALNHAFRDGRVPSDSTWRRVTPFKNVDAARIRYLSIAEAKRLLNACEPDFRDVVQAALLTGCRYGELCRLTVTDFNPDAGTIAIRQSKSGKPRHAVLTDEGAEFFAALCAGRAGSDTMLRKADGSAWGTSHQNRPMAAAVARARITPAVGFHCTRHTFASHAVMNGAPLLVVAKNLGHSDTRMVERHYGHLAPSYIADAIRAAAPRFGAVKPSNLTAIR
jgi:integrase